MIPSIELGLDEDPELSIEPGTSVDTAFVERVQEELLAIGRHPRKDVDDLEEAAVAFAQEAETLEHHFAEYLAADPDVDVVVDVDADALEDEILDAYREALDTDERSELDPVESVLELAGVDEEAVPSLGIRARLAALRDRVPSRGGSDEEEIAA